MAKKYPKGYKKGRFWGLTANRTQPYRLRSNRRSNFRNRLTFKACSDEERALCFYGTRRRALIKTEKYCQVSFKKPQSVRTAAFRHWIQFGCGGNKVQPAARNSSSLLRSSCSDTPALRARQVMQRYCSAPRLISFFVMPISSAVTVFPQRTQTFTDR